MRGLSDHLCKGVEKWPNRLQPRAFQGQAQKQPCYPDRVLKPTGQPPLVPPFLLAQNLSPKPDMTLQDESHASLSVKVLV